MLNLGVQKCACAIFYAFCMSDEPMCACLNIDHSLITCSIDFNIVNIHHNVGMYFLILTGNRDDIEWHDLQRSSHPIHDTLPAPLGVYWALGTVFLDTFP